MYVVFSVLVANALRDSKRPERFIVLVVLAAMIPVTAIVSMVAFVGFDLSYLQSRRGFLSGLGLHANEFGKLLAFVFGPLLYVSFASKGPRRLFFGLATVALLCGILLTFTRAAYVAVAIVAGVFLLQRKRPGLVIAMAIGITVLALVAPSAIIDRITTGVDERSIESARAGSLNDELTAGRVGGYQLLLPEVLRSPLWGRGTGATAWSAPVTSGHYGATHPHNMYLESTLDIGLIGLCLSLYFYYRLLDGMKRLARNPTLSGEMQAFFEGSAAAFISILVLSFAGGHWYPHPEQALMWIAFGITFAYWPWVEAERQRERMAAAEHTGTATPRKRTASPASWS
jgi:O-antigen ligase